jgi:hypothetical protein
MALRIPPLALGDSELMAQHQGLRVLPPRLPPRQAQHRHRTGHDQEISFKPTGRRSSHLRTDQVLPARHPNAGPSQPRSAEHLPRWRRFSASTPSLGSLAPSARSAPRPAHRPAACRCDGDRSTASGPAAGASAAACPASRAGSSAAAWGAAWSGRRVSPGRPSPASAWVLAPQHCDLMPEHHQLGVLRRR